jgi:hypothetical protein
VARSWLFFLGGRATLFMLSLANILLSRPKVVREYGKKAVAVGFSLALLVDVTGCIDRFI